MRAVVFTDKLRFEPHHPEPTLSEGECLIRVRLAGICATDIHITRGYMGFQGIIGHEMVATVVEGSPAWLGKRVVSEINCVCRTCDMCQAGLANHCRKRTVVGIEGRSGCFADVLAVPETNLHAIPDVVTDEEAVFVEPLAAAYQVLAQCRMESRTRVAVVGSGRLGQLVAQVIKAGGCQPTVVGRNRNKLLMCEKRGIQSLHVDEVIPRSDFDVVVECSGSPGGLELAMKMVRPRGTLVLKSTYAMNATVDLSPLVIHEINLIGSRCGPFPEAIQALARRAIEVRPLISKTLPIERAEEAFVVAASSENVKVLLAINPE